MVIGLRIQKLLFLSNNTSSSIEFSNSVHIVNGASNTGKSLLIEAIDYMLGAENLKKVSESAGYNEIVMQIYLNDKPYTIFRKWPSTTFEIYNGLTESKENANFYNHFKIGKPTKSVNNISLFYLEGYTNTQISSNLFGEKSALTIRLLSRIILSSEEKIIRSDSPIIVGDTSENSKNKNVFKFLLTGKDDSNFETVTRGNEFKSEKKGQVSVLTDIVKTLKSNLIFSDDSYESLNERSEKLDITIDELIVNIDLSQHALSEIVSEKKKVSNELMDVSERINIIQANLANFKILKDIYINDIERLTSQEEAAFLIGIGHKGKCDVCGNIPKKIDKDLIEINILAEASTAEIKKIDSKLVELSDTNIKLDKQRILLLSREESLKIKLKNLDKKTEKRVPELKVGDHSLMTLRSERARFEIDLSLHERISFFSKKLQEAELKPVPKKYEAKAFYPENDAIDNFCRIYSEILKNIKLPGTNHVEFDYKIFDVIIDGNPRNLNGKGVRAILHSVFKIALLLHCRQKNIYHPGVVILDSPLVTYRDPLESKYGELEEDEKKLAETKISYHFLNYLHSISKFGQFIIIENIDVPESLKSIISNDTFYGKKAKSGQRVGLLNC